MVFLIWAFFVPNFTEKISVVLLTKLLQRVFFEQLEIQDKDY